MTISRLMLAVGLLAVVPAVFSGCGQGDGGEFRPYSDAAGTELGAATDSIGSEKNAVAPADAPVQSGDANLVALVPAEALAESPITVPMAQETVTGTEAPAESIGDVTATSKSVPANSIAGAALPAAPREIKLLVPEKSFRAAGPEGALRVTYDDLDLLKVLNMEPVTVDAPDHFPQWLTDLEGKRIRLRGYMRPDLVAEGLTGFILARDTQACCFGPNTKPYDIIPTMLREGVTTDYIELRPFDVVGVFHIEVNETRSRTGERKVEFLYNIDDAVIIQL